ncbi:MAG: hypothetical protein JWQ29_623 [Phenylobacterium sp.]|nr:hypothetical protein [Phenylobacterium sp.]
MSIEPDIADLEEQMLSRLAQLDLTAAERVHGRLMVAEAAADVADLGRTYQRVARSLRQTLALKAQLKRAREQGLKDAPPARPGGVAVARRIRELRLAVLRVIWNEAEGDDFANFGEEELEQLIAEECLRDSFCAEPLDDHIARVCMALGLSSEAAEAWRDLPDPPGAPRPANGQDAEPPRRSSA